MVLKKPGQSDAAEPAKPATSDTSFMEHLVKKSLDVNPGLRAGRSTQEVLKSLRQEAIANAEAGQPDAALSIPEAAASPAVSADERRLKSIQFFWNKRERSSPRTRRVLQARLPAFRLSLTG